MQDEFDSFEHKKLFKSVRKKIHKVIKSHQNLARCSKVLKNLVTKVTLILGCNNVAVYFATCCNLMSLMSTTKEEEGTAEENWIFFLHFLAFSFIDVYCAKTIMEICYAQGAMEKTFMAVFSYTLLRFCDNNKKKREKFIAF